MGLAFSSWGADAAHSEYQVKAAFIYNFIKFVQWPEGTFPAPETSICIGVIGRDSVAVELEKVVQNKNVKERSVVVKRGQSLEELRECHVLFITGSDKRKLPQIFESLGAKPVLTIGETDQFAEMGGIINFFQEEKRIRFQINVDAARRAELKIDSTLLNLARIVRDKNPIGRPK